MIFTKVIKKRLRFLVFICVFIFLVGVDHATKHYFHTQTFFWAKDYKYKVEGDKRYLIPNNTKKTISNFLLKKNEVVSKRYLFTRRRTSLYQRDDYSFLIFGLFFTCVITILVFLF